MIEFLRAEKNDISQLKTLWLLCFDDTKEAVNLFFDENDCHMRTYCARDNETVVSALYLLDADLNGQKAHYLCGASTKSDYRRKGIMGKLINFALESAMQDGDKFSVLMPANSDLYEYYSKFGYRSECFAEKRIYLRDELLSFDDCCSEEDYDFETMQKISFKDNFLLWNNDFKKFACDYYKLYGTNVICTNNCFALFEEENDCAEVFYAVYSNRGVLAKNLLKKSNARQFIVWDKAKDNSNKERYGMIKSLDNNMKIPENVFIGITLM